ncbi:MAG TPA: heparinase II/III family protein, partial [Gemmatimonadales bacterium]|nr:heparinase II/III family protein [Gemmatimonadales bacterium]
RLQMQLAAALRAPALTALPDRTFPARKDSRFGVSLAQPMYLELWEVGLARLSRSENAPAELWSWLQELYVTPAPSAQTFDSYLHEAGDRQLPATRTRSDLSWWALLEMVPALPQDCPPWAPAGTFMESQGLALLRDGSRYVSVECGNHGGGHGHPDRLNLTLHADGQYWLPDFGTGSYVARDLFWYRSTLAHNAPRLDGVSQPLADAVCDNFDQKEGWAWVRGRFQNLSRTVVAGPRYVLDILELSDAEDHVLDLPFHLSGESEVENPGTWFPAELPAEEFVREPERFVPAADGTFVLRSSSRGATLAIHLLFDGYLIRARAPGPPHVPGLRTFYIVRGEGRKLRVISVLDSSQRRQGVTGLRSAGTAVEVQTMNGVEHHTPTVEGWEIRTGSSTVQLTGAQRHAAPFEPLVQTNRPSVARGIALQVVDAPMLDGTLGGFDTGDPLELDHEDQYRRSEEPYAGPEEFSARAYVNWNDEGLYLAVEVTKPEVFPRDPNTAPLRLDNEPDEIHGDGIQVYLQLPGEETVHGFLIVPSVSGDLITRPATGTATEGDSVSGSWQASETGYAVTVGIQPAGWDRYRPGEELGFDLLINQMLPERTRRAGQLVWSGGGGWVWLRGDRQDPARLGRLEFR